MGAGGLASHRGRQQRPEPHQDLDRGLRPKDPEGSKELLSVRFGRSATSREEFTEPSDRGVSDPAEGVGEPRLRIDAVWLRRFDRRVGDRRAFGPSGRGRGACRPYQPMSPPTLKAKKA